MRGSRQLNLRRAKSKRTEKVSKRPSAPWIALLSTIGAAAISAAVSFFVATAKLNSEDSVSRAKLFNELIEQFQKEGGDRYALLSLWKIYPEDRRLVLITALQDPTPETIKLLTQLGYKEELENFQEDIKKIYETSSGENRRAISSLFQVLSPIEQADIALNRIQSSEVSDTDTEEYIEFYELLRASPDVRDYIENKIQTTPSFEHRVLLAYGLFLSGEPAPLNNTLSDLRQNIDWFPALADFFGKRNPLSLGEIERSSILGLAEQHAQHVVAAKKSQIELFFSLDVTENFFPNTLTNQTNKENVASILRLVAQEGRIVQRDVALRLMNDFDLQPAADVEYFEAVFCNDDSDEKELLFRSLAYGGRLFETTILRSDYNEAEAAITAKMKELDIECS